MIRLVSAIVALAAVFAIVAYTTTSIGFWLCLLLFVVVFLIGLTIYDVTQTRHAILRNFPIVGHFRYLLESIGPELRQYIVTDNNEERPFSRDQRRWVYASAKRENPYFGFGTDNQFETPDYLIIRHSAFPHPGHADMGEPLPGRKVLGEWRNRPTAHVPRSIVNVSAMSFGSLSSTAVQALNKGCQTAGAMHNTGEGGISSCHRQGGDLMFQIGTGYFGCRDAQGAFSLDRLVESVSSAPVKAIEIKLSQGAKPGLGGVLPAAKVTEEIAAARGVPVGKTVISPSAHSAFTNIDELITFVETIASATGLPVGIKSAVGQQQFWGELADTMSAKNRGPDFITIDGGEGGTGAAPLVFSDHVSMPFRLGFAEVYREFATRSMHERVTFIGSGRLGFPAEALVALTMGVDLIAVAREAMLSIGCIQALKCHTGHCPTGVATQNPRLTRGLDPTNKGDRLANYLISMRYDLRRLAYACGVEHPSMVSPEHVQFLEAPNRTQSVTDRFGYDLSWRSETNVGIGNNH